MLPAFLMLASYLPLSQIHTCLTTSSPFLTCLSLFLAPLTYLLASLPVICMSSLFYTCFSDFLPHPYLFTCPCLTLPAWPSFWLPPPVSLPHFVICFPALFYLLVCLSASSLLVYLTLCLTVFLLVFLSSLPHLFLCLSL